MILREEDVDPLVLRVAIALFQTDRDAGYAGWDAEWDDLPDLSGVLIDKSYWLNMARCLIIPPVSPDHSKP